MMVVSNTSPITNLALVGQLDMLQQLYGSVVIPQAVSQEIVRVVPRLPGAVEVQKLPWIQTRAVTSQVLVTSLQLELDDGEAEAITLAIELQADLLLLDERLGRIVASRLGIKFIGLLGVLIEAKHQGLVPAVKPILDDLIVQAGFWISRALYDRVIQSAGE